MFKKGTVTPSRVNVQLGLIRTGHLAKIKLLNLIDKDDSSTIAEPLKGFSVFSPVNAGIHFRDSYSRFKQALQISSPSVAFSAIPFLDELQKVIVKAFDEGVPHAIISQYYYSIMMKVSENTRNYSVAAKGGSQQCIFDIDLLVERTDAYDALKEAHQKQSAKKAAREEYERLNGSKGQRNDDDDDVVTVVAQKRPRGGKPNKDKQKVPKVVDSNPRGDGVDKSKPATPNPMYDRSLKTKEQKQAAWDKFNTDHPKVNGVSQCWDYWHSQGCKHKPGECKFGHGS